MLTNMRSAIDEGTFEINDYLHQEVIKFYGRNLIPKWVEMKHQQNLSPLHLDEIDKFIRRFLNPFFDDMDCRVIKTFHIEDFFPSLPAHWHDKTKKNAMTNLHAFVNWLFRREVLPRMPAFPTISPPEPPIEWIDRETQLRIIEGIPARLKDLYNVHVFSSDPYRGSVCIEEEGL